MHLSEISFFFNHFFHLYVYMYIMYYYVGREGAWFCVEVCFREKNTNQSIYTMLREPLGVRCRLRRGSGGMYWCG